MAFCGMSFGSLKSYFDNITNSSGSDRSTFRQLLNISSILKKRPSQESLVCCLSQLGQRGHEIYAVWNIF